MINVSQNNVVFNPKCVTKENKTVWPEVGDMEKGSLFATHDE